MAQIPTYVMVALILFVVTFIPLVIFAGEIKETLFSISKKSECEASVKAHAALCLKGITNTEIRCPTITLPIKGNDEEKIKGDLAKAMYDCWDQFGEGEKEICGETGVYCSFCNYIPFENKDLKIEGFSEYLETNYIPDKSKGKITYSEFLTTKKTLGSDFISEKKKKGINDILDTSKEDQYATAFVYIKGKKQLQNYLKKAEYTIPGLGVVALGFGIVKAGGAVTGLGIATGPGIIAGPIITSIGGLIMLGGSIYSVFASYLVEYPFDHIAFLYFGPYNSQELSDLGCNQLPSYQGNSNNVVLT